MVAGEAIQVRQKHRLARVIDWPSHGILVGNELPSAWSTQEGALERRLMCFEMNKQVSSDITLSTLKAERAQFIPKCLRAYTSCVRAIADGEYPSFDSMIPDSLKLSTTRTVNVSNIFSEFLHSGCIQFGDEYSISVRDFRDELAKFYADVYQGGKTAIEWKQSDFEPVFTRFHLTLTSVCHYVQGIGFCQSILGCSRSTEAAIPFDECDENMLTIDALDAFNSLDIENESKSVCTDQQTTSDSSQSSPGLSQRSEYSLANRGYKVRDPIDYVEDPHTRHTIDNILNAEDLHTHPMELIKRTISEMSVKMLCEFLGNIFKRLGTYTMPECDTIESHLDCTLDMFNSFECDSQTTLEFTERFSTYRAVVLLIRVHMTKKDRSIEEDEMSPRPALINGVFLAVQNRLYAIYEYYSWKFSLKHQNSDYIHYSYPSRLQFFDECSIMLDGTLARSRAADDVRYNAIAGTYVYNVAKSHGFTHRSGYIYKPIYSKTGRFVYTYRPHMAFDDFVYNVGIHPMVDPAWKKMMMSTDMSGLIR